MSAIGMACCTPAVALRRLSEGVVTAVVSSVDQATGCLTPSEGFACPPQCGQPG